MENASKALIIAGAILLAILLISLAIVVYNQARGTIDDANIDAEAVQTFNSKFDAYLGNISGTTANALVSLCNANGVTITVDSGSASKNKGSASWPSFEKNESLNASVETKGADGKIASIVLK